MKDVRNSLLLKALVFLLALSCAAGTALGAVGLAMLDFGYGTIGSTYYEDPLFFHAAENAMYSALWEHTEEYGYYSWRLRTNYEGFSCVIYDGEAGGEPVYTWEVPSSGILRHTITVESNRAKSGYYTVEGYLEENLTWGGDFWFLHGVYRALDSFRFGGLLPITLLLGAGTLLCLIFLVCAAGHHRGIEGISPGWQERIPLDLYLCIVGFAFALTLALACDLGGFGKLLWQCLIFSLCMLVCAVLALAAFLTLVTRFKLGKWWRGTIVFMVLRWCVRLVKACGRGVVKFVRLLPMAWRTAALVCAVLFVQSVLTLLMWESYSEWFFFLLLSLMDLLVLAGAVWLAAQLRRVKDAGEAMAAGELDTRVDTRRMYHDVRVHGEHLNSISEGMNRAVEQRMRSERLKTELITNVSHDIKTPLTSIVNYVDLLKKEELTGEAGEYVAVLDRQATRLKKLTEDLVEASKASTGNMAVNMETIVVGEIVHQAVGDYDERLAAGGFEVIVTTPEEMVTARADGRLLWRVLDNLLGNVCKYALGGTRVYVDVEQREDEVTVAIKNISRDRLNISGDELMERFVRGDTSRHTEGSGLGLNIAGSLMELMGGSCRVSADGDLFKAALTLKKD